ncbi:hypothetical protein EI94DRAFT_1702544 [Lactarius quietus]|nr:hypothetical protein EI94DRAFT_1702544 [Lactarius quietus]
MPIPHPSAPPPPTSSEFPYLTSAADHYSEKAADLYGCIPFIARTFSMHVPPTRREKQCACTPYSTFCYRPLGHAEQEPGAVPLNLRANGPEGWLETPQAHRNNTLPGNDQLVKPARATTDYLTRDSAASYSSIVGLAGTIPKRMRMRPGYREFRADHELIMARIARSHSRNRGSNSARMRTSIVDHGSPGSWHGTSATAPATTIACNTPKVESPSMQKNEILAARKDGNGKRGVPADPSLS